MTEEWRDIIGFEGTYQVSNLGRIRRMTPSIRVKVVPHIMRPALSRNGYEVVKLCKNSKYTHKYVHRVVAECFLEKLDGCTEVNHIDGIKLNNAVSNLEWCSHSSNNSHRTRVLRAYANKRNYVVTSPTGAIYEVCNLTEFCEQHGLNQSGLGHVLNGRQSHHHGYTAKYKET